MKIDRSGFIKYCNDIIKSNNRNIKKLSKEIDEYEAIISVATKTDISKQLLETYKNKIDKCLDKIEHYLQSTQNKKDLINVIKRANKIINQNQGGKIYG